MVEGHEKMLRGVRAFSSILQLYESGCSTEQVKRVVLESLRSEFENPDLLDRYDIGLLTVEAVNIQRIRSQLWSSDLYDACMNIRKRCLSIKQEECSRVSAAWLGAIRDALTLYWNSARLEYDKSDFSLGDFAYEIFRNIGALIEGTLQSYLKEMVHLVKILNGKETAFREVDQLNLGSLVKVLSDTTEIKDLLVVPPWGIPLNQWRNIAQHYSIRTDGQAIRCEYGSRRQYVVELSRKELLDLARSLFLVHSALRTSHTIFFLDNADLLSKHCEPFERDKSDRLFQFSVSAASQGFEVTSLEISDHEASAVLVDVTDSEEIRRAIHASQFAFQLWVATKAENIEIKYKSKVGRRSLRSRVKGGDCEKVYKGEEELAYLARVATFDHQEMEGNLGIDN